MKDFQSNKKAGNGRATAAKRPARFIAEMLFVWLGCALVAVCLAAPTDSARPARPKGVPPPKAVRVERDLQYVEGNNPAQTLDLYLPEAPGDKPLPVIVWIHGGAWAHGSNRAVTGLDMVPEGYALASVEYRFVGEALFPAQIQDCQAAIRWLRAHSGTYHLDPEHIGAWGGSAGGHLAALLGTAGGKNAFPLVGENKEESDRVQAVCDWYGPADLNLQYWPGLFGKAAKTQANCDYASPVHYVSKDTPPFLIMHGTLDHVVGIKQSEVLVEALQKAGVDVTFQKMYGSQHGVGIGYGTVRGMIKSFFDKHLKGMRDVKVELLPDDVATVKPRTAKQLPDAPAP